MSIKTLNRSFAGGEITPELFGRLDLSKYQTGLKTCRNFEILPHGPASNRPGFEYVLETKFSNKRSILLPFIYNTSQTYQLEFGDLYVRFHTNNGTVLEAALNVTAATNANPGVLTSAGHGYTAGQWVFCAGFSAAGWATLNGRFAIVQNVTLNTFTLTDLDGVAINTTAYGGFVAGTVARVYEIVSPYAAADLLDSSGAVWLHITQSNDVFTICHPLYQARELKRFAPTNWAFNVVTVVPTQGPPTAPVATPTGAGAINYTYAVTAVAANTIEESVQTADATCANDLTIAGHTNAITWTDVAGAVRYNVYKKISGLYGFIGQSGGGVAGLVDNNITPNATVTPPIANDPISAVNDYPSGVGYYGGRRWFGGSNNKPLRLVGTKSGTESNMGYTIPSQANDAVAVNLVSKQNNTIRHIVPLSDLLCLTSGSEFVVSSGTAGVPITPTNIAAHAEDYIGASNVAPIITAGSIVYAQDRGGRMRELTFQWQQQGYRSADISIMAPHLFDGYTLSSSGYARAPSAVGWVTRSDGTLLGLTYVPEHQVSAWHHHDTQGTFECVCVTPEGSEDVLYAIVNRTMRGRTVRSVERKRSRLFGTLPNAFFVDCGLTYSGAPATTISGLWHLVGQTVSILADGAVVPPQIVAADSSITLDLAASVVQIGLSYIADFETLPLAIEQVMAMAQGMTKNVNEVILRLNNTSGVQAGPSTARLTTLKQRSNEAYGSPPRMLVGVYRVKIGPSWNEDATICVRQPDPLPISILSMVLDTAEGG